MPLNAQVFITNSWLGIQFYTFSVQETFQLVRTAASPPGFDSIDHDKTTDKANLQYWHVFFMS